MKVKSVLCIVAVFLAALAVRSVVLLEWLAAGLNNFIHLDQMNYHSWALSMITGDAGQFQGYAGYPVFLTFLYKAGGFIAPGVLVRGAQVLIGALQAPLLFIILTRLNVRGSIAAAAALVLAFCQPHAFYSMLVVPTVLSSFLLLLFAFQLTAGQNSVFSGVRQGLLLGFASAVRGNFIPVSLVNLLWSVKRKKALTAFIFIWAIVYVSFGLFTDSTSKISHGGVNFWLANNPTADSRYVPPSMNEDVREKLPLNVLEKSGLAEEGRSRYGLGFWVGQTFQAHFNNPSDLWRLFRVKLFLITSGLPMPDILTVKWMGDLMPLSARLPFDSSFIWPIGLLSALYLVFMCKDRTVKQISALFLVYTASILWGLVHERYKIPLLPICVLLSAYLLNEALNAKKQTAALIAVLLISWGIAEYGWRSEIGTFSRGAPDAVYLRLGDYYRAMQQPERSAMMYERALMHTEGEKREEIASAVEILRSK